MGFLQEYDSISTSDPSSQAAFVIKWLRGNPTSMFDELRVDRPIFVNPVFTMVVRATDVLDILSQHQLFSVRLNAKTMDPAVGPFMLARDETELNWHEKSIMRAVLRHDDLPRLKAFVGNVVNNELSTAQGRLDVVARISRLVPLRIVQSFFGFAAPDELMLKWSFATQHAMFRNLGGDPVVERACVDAGVEMRNWLWPFLASKWANPDLSDDTPVDRLIRLSRSSDLAISTDRIVSNVCGLLVGAIETMSQAIVQSFDQLLQRNDVLPAAIKAAKDVGSDDFDSYAFEALRFNPITAMQIRYAERDCQLGVGTPYATQVTRGSRIAACTGPAMFDEGLFREASAFKVDRPRESYLHLGFGHHECLGKYVALVAIPETIRQLLSLPGVRRAAGDSGKIDFAGGPFPEHFGIEWDQAKLQ